MAVNQHINRTLNVPLYPDVFNRYVSESGRVRTVQTKKSLRSHVNRLQSMHPGKKARDFRSADLAAYCLLDNCSPNTIKARRAALIAVFGWATFVGLVVDNPARDLKYLVQPGSHSVRRHTWLRPDQFRQLLRELPADTLKERRDRILIYVGAMVGLRVLNLAGLRWSDFTPDLTRLRVTVKRQKLQEFGIPDLLVHELTLWRKELRPDQGDDGPLFPTFHRQIGDNEYQTICNYDTPLHDSGIFRAINDTTLAAIGIQMRPHDLRRSFASYLESEGFSIEDISRALGHENIATTSRYLDMNPHRAVSVGRSLNVRL
jgi:integrase